MRKIDNQSGFSLIEMIAVMVLVALLSAMAGMGIVAGLQGYLFAKENTPTTQKAQLALSRLSREFMEISNVTTAQPSAMIFQNIRGSRAVALVGGEIKIREGAALPDGGNGDALIDHVDSFGLTYHNGAAPWTAGADEISLLSRIRIDLVVNRPDSGIGNISFFTEINPRNTGTLNAPVQ